MHACYFPCRKLLDGKGGNSLNILAPSEVRQRIIAPATLRQIRTEHLNCRTNSNLSRLLRAIDTLSGVALITSLAPLSKLGHFPSSLREYLDLSITLGDTALIFALSLCWWVVVTLVHATESAGQGTMAEEIEHSTIACGIIVLLLGLGGVLSRALTPTQVGIFGAALTIVVLATHLAARPLEIAFLRRFASTKTCIIVGSGPRAQAMYRMLKNSQYTRYDILGFIDERGRHSLSDELRRKVIGSLGELKTILQNTVVDEVFLALPVKSFYGQIQEAIHTCEEVGIECKLPSDLFSCSLARMRVEHKQSSPMLSMQVVRNDHTRWIKSAMDRVAAALALIVFALPMALIALAIVLSSQGPVLFAQRRFGLNKRIFTMYKFRTMKVDAENMQAQLETRNEMGGPVFKIRNDPRVTPFGRWLRRTSLDELPQLWNVLRGDMSLVGPRPLPVRDVSKFGEAWLMRRFSMKPGLTCLWQIGGRNSTTFERWMELDLQYIDRWSIWLDCEILLKTVPAVLRGEGAM
jgi:exopolysaccharide biosynthesis polyprenyl glycosylphosphotransferase